MTTSSRAAARFLLRICLPPAVAEAAIGDLEEELQARPGVGWVAAEVWYWTQVLSLALAYLREGRRLGVRELPAESPVARGRRMHHHRRSAAMESVLRDFRYATRRLMASPMFTAMAILVVAIGIAANTVVFSAVNATLLRPEPFEDATRLVHVYQDSDEGEPESSSFPAYREIAARTDVFSGAAALYTTAVNVDTGVSLRQSLVEFATASYFPVLGLEPHQGRWFAADEDEPGASAVAVVSHHAWRTRFGADPSVVGRTLRLGGAPVTIIGIGPARYNGAVRGMAVDFWLSLSALGPVVGQYAAQTVNRPQDHWFLVRARLRDGVTVPQAQTAMDDVSRRLETLHAGLDQRRPISVLSSADVRIHPLVDGALVPGASLLASIVGLVLALVCSNLAILLLLRGTARRREVSIRVALGAGRASIVRQFFSESLLLSLAGGAAGLLLAAWLLRTVSALQIPLVPGALDLTLDYRVLAFALVLSLLTGSGFGLAPALRAARADIVAALRDGATTGGRSWLTLRNAMVAFQVALSVVLLAGTGLVVRSVRQMERIDPGFEQERLAFVETNARQGGYEQAEIPRVYAELERRLAELPGVESLTVSAQPPLGGRGTSTLVIDGYVSPGGTNTVEVPWAFVAPAYFETLRIRILHGRAFGRQDDTDAPAVAVVSAAMARRYWGTADVVGRRYRHDARPDSWVEIVGVADDVKVRSLVEDPQPLFYRPWAQQPTSVASFIVRTAGSPASLVGALARTVRELDPALPVLRAMTLNAHVATQLQLPVLATFILTGFSLVAIALAALGLYAIVAFTVGERVKEVGIRMALGARGSHVLWTIIRGVMATVGAGLVAGVGLAVAAGQGLKGVLYNVSPADPMTLGAVTAVLALVALAATCVPARRAVNADPTAALRHT